MCGVLVHFRPFTIIQNGCDKIVITRQTTMTRRQATLACGAALTGFGAERDASERIRLSRVPQNGLQPQMAVDDIGNLHMVFYSGDPRQGNLIYVKSEDGGTSFSRPVQVNSDPGSAIAIGTIRGAQIALGKDGRVHVAWNGSKTEGPLNPDSGQFGTLVVGAWETGGQVFWARLDGGAIQPISPPGEGKARKHPRVAVNRSGNILLVWTEGTGWQKGGSLAYQVFDLRGNPLREQGRLAGIPTWSFAAANARTDNSFLIIY